jgi:hypothetical protein
MMQLKTAQRKRAKIKMGIQGSSGSGKTYNSLLIAKGLTGGDLTKVAVIDTENGSSNLYSHLGEYNVLPLSPPYTPQKYAEAIKVCEDAGMEVVIIDSTSHCWEYLLDYHSQMSGNSFQNWNKIKPLEKIFIDKILQSNCHIIATMRCKQDYVLNQKDGKYIPEKVGLKSIMRDGIDYEYTLVFDIDIKHNATSSKDRTGLFMGKPEFQITEETGTEILKWCNSGSPITLEEVREKIKNCNEISELKSVYNAYIEWKDKLSTEFSEQKQSILAIKELTNPQNFSLNGSK